LTWGEVAKEFSMSNRTYSCGLDAALSVVSGRWKFLVIWHLATGGPLRFGQLRRLAEGVSEKMLISSLKELEFDGAVLRTDYGEKPLRVEYTLTPAGAELAEALRPLCQWAHAHVPQRIGPLPATACEAPGRRSPPSGE
jgi:DNA-binding HxlR family transcriptional regulator